MELLAECASEFRNSRSQDKIWLLVILLFLTCEVIRRQHEYKLEVVRMGYYKQVDVVAF